MAAGHMQLEVVTPDGSAATGEAREVTAQGMLGQFTARPGHQPYLVQLEPGTLRYPDRAGKVHTFSVTGGLAEVTSDRVIVLADACEAARAIDVRRAQASQQRAEERMGSKDTSVDRDRAERSLARAKARLAVAKGGK